jgi:L-serine deaminase
MHHAISARAGHEVDTAPLAGYRGIDDRHGG